MKDLNLPNKLTIIRILLIPACLFMLVAFHDEWWGRVAAGAIFGIASLTDMLDGRIARRDNLITDFGKFLDPLADKFLVISVLIALVCTEDYSLFGILLFCAVIIIVFRELAVTSMRLVVATSPDKIVIAANKLGKIKTCTQIIFIEVATLEPALCILLETDTMHIITYVAMAAAVVMTVWSGLSYMLGYWKYLDPSK